MDGRTQRKIIVVTKLQYNDLKLTDDTWNTDGTCIRLGLVPSKNVLSTFTCIAVGTGIMNSNHKNMVD